MAFNSLRHKQLGKLKINRNLNRSSESFKQDAQTLVSTWIERVVNCVFDDKDKNTKTLAANDSSPAQKKLYPGNHDYFLRITSLNRKNLVAIFSVWSRGDFQHKMYKNMKNPRKN